MKKSGRIITIGMAALLAASLCACGRKDEDSYMDSYTADMDSMTEEELEAEMSERLNALDAINEQEEAEKKAEEEAEAQAEALAMEEAKRTITDYSAPNIELTDIDPVSTGAQDVIGLDFSTFPETNGSFTYTWDYSSYSDEAEISSVTGEPFEPVEWYKLTMRADGNMYDNFKDDVVAWLESQNIIAESNTAVQEAGKLNNCMYWLSPEKAVEFVIDGEKISFQTYCMKTYHYEGTFEFYKYTSTWEDDAPVENVYVTLNEDIEDSGAGSKICYLYVDPVSGDDYDYIMNNGAKAMNGTDLTQYISIDSDLCEGDLVSVDVTAPFLKAAGMDSLIDGKDFLQLSIHKIG